eukprot:3939659-Rhodomonas_salina.2
MSGASESFRVGVVRLSRRVHREAYRVPPIDASLDSFLLCGSLSCTGGTKNCTVQKEGYNAPPFSIGHP